ncbi:MAG: hypothetical protein CMA03_05350 [Euryarchaeota archaeon]|nr:hypothetical protein [Euryarchaeota archaeon]
MILLKLLIVGSLAYDSISTEYNDIKNTLGGSAVYAGISAAGHMKRIYEDSNNKIGLVGVIGTDFLDSDLEVLKKHGLDISGIKKEDGLTFRWSGSYSGDMSQAITHSTELNVFETFSPIVPKKLQSPEITFCANMHPLIQSSVLDQSKPQKFAAVDSMNLWINNTPKELSEILRRVKMAILNSDEVKMLAKCENIIDAGNLIRSGEALFNGEKAGKGPDILIIKKGGEGVLALFEDSIIELPAYPTSKLIDPTGCGDSFAGALLAHLSNSSDKFPTKKELFDSLIHANVTASFTIEEMGVNRIKNINEDEYEERLLQYLELI